MLEQVKLEILEELIKIINKVKIKNSNADNLQISQADYNEPLTGNFFYFSDIEMVYLLLEIQKHYKIRFIEEDVKNYKFNTILNITNCIYEKLSLKN